MKICRCHVQCQACTCGIRIQGCTCLSRTPVRLFARIAALNTTSVNREVKFRKNLAKKTKILKNPLKTNNCLIISDNCIYLLKKISNFIVGENRLKTH